MNRHTALLIFCLGTLLGCSQEPRPRSVDEFIDNPIMLEAAMVRCSQDRSGTKYDAECVNARTAVGRIEAKEEAVRRAAFDARSEEKRQSLRRTQQAAAEARRRAEEAAKLREEAEYLAQFGASPAQDFGEDSVQEMGNLPTATVQEADPGQENSNGPASLGRDTTPATDGGNAPTGSNANEAPAEQDLDSIRDELRRRSDEQQD